MIRDAVMLTGLPDFGSPMFDESSVLMKTWTLDHMVLIYFSGSIVRRNYLSADRDVGERCRHPLQT